MQTRVCAAILGIVYIVLLSDTVAAGAPGSKAQRGAVHPLHSRLLSLDLDGQEPVLSPEEQQRQRHPREFSSPSHFPGLPDLYIIDGHRDFKQRNAAGLKPDSKTKPKAISKAEWLSSVVGGRVASISGVNQLGLKKKIMWEEPPPSAPIPTIPLYWIGLDGAEERRNICTGSARIMDGLLNCVCTFLASMEGLVASLFGAH